MYRPPNCHGLIKIAPGPAGIASTFVTVTRHDGGSQAKEEAVTDCERRLGSDLDRHDVSPINAQPHWCRLGQTTPVHFWAIQR
jgi:hypothetical protein